MSVALTPVVAARVGFTLLGMTTLITVVFTCVTDGSPFRWEVLTPWMAATLVDFYANVVAIATWVCYKEETWVGKILWTLLLICFGSMATGLYVVVQLFKISATDPLYHVLLRPTHAKYAAIESPPSEPLRPSHSHAPRSLVSFSQWLKSDSGKGPSSY